MLKTTLSLLATVVLTTVIPLHAAEATASASPSHSRSLFGSDDHDGPFRHALRSAVQRLLAFRNETPLTAEQRTQVRSVLEKHRGEIRTQLATAREARAAMHQAVVDGTDAKDAADRIGESARTGAQLYAKVAREIRPLLTPEQRQRLDTTFEQFQAEVGQIAGTR